MKVRTHWTHSSLKEFETCPAKYQWNYLFELKDWQALGYKVAPYKPSPAAQRGTDVHQTCEDFVRGKVGVDGLHKDISPAWRNLIVDLKKRGAVAEEQWEFCADWHPREEGEQLWLRMKIDVHLQLKGDALELVDYKTGNPYRENVEQLEIYTLGAFAKYDNINTVHGALWYLDHDEPLEKTFKREQAAKLARKWESRSGRLLEATSFPPRKNFFCKWCPFNFASGGPCKAAA